MPKATRRAMLQGKRARGAGTKTRNHYQPPEDWHEPRGTSPGAYRVIMQRPGRGYRHILTPQDIRGRLAALPPRYLELLEVVQLSRMTRKKCAFPCYGMHWGCSIYLYPIEEELVEYFNRPPRPAEYHEARMYGGRWIEQSSSSWKLVWTRETIRDFYLNNVLIHELGHLLDQRNTNFRDRERFAEWFAFEHGFKPSRQRSRRR